MTAAVDGGRHDKSRNAGSANDVEDGWRPWAGVRWIKLPMEGFRSCNDGLSALRGEAFANLGRRYGQNRGGSDPAGFAPGRIGFSMHLAVRVLVGDAENGQGPVRQPVLRKFYGRYLIRRGDDRLMGKADKQQRHGADDARTPLPCTRNCLPHSCPHHPHPADKVAVIGQAHYKRNASIRAAAKFADIDDSAAPTASKRPAECQIDRQLLIARRAAPDSVDHSDLSAAPDIAWLA